MAVEVGEIVEVHFPDSWGNPWYVQDVQGRQAVVVDMSHKVIPSDYRRENFRYVILVGEKYPEAFHVNNLRALTGKA